MLEASRIRIDSRLRGPQPANGPVVRMDVSLRRVTMIVVLFFLQFGLISLLIAGDLVIGQKIASMLILLGIVAAPLASRTTFQLNTLADVFPILLLLLIVAVSYFANNHVFLYGTDNWLLYTYIMVPLLAYYLFWVFSVTAADMLAAFIMIGVISGVIVALDSVFLFEALKPLVRFTNETGTRRVPILKNETVLAFCLLFADVYGRRRWWRSEPWAIAALPVLFYVVVFCFESRIALAAMLVSVVIYLAARRIDSMPKLLLLVFGLLFGVPLLTMALDRYITPLLTQDLTSYSQTHNVDVRFESAQYFYEYFQQTYGLGFGLMTLNREAHNFQSDGVPLSFGVADLGMFGSLYQFGWLGLAMLVIATCVMGYRLFVVGRGNLHPARNRVLMVGSYVAGFSLQPIPMNFFTLNWTALLGASLWYLTRRVRWEADQVRLPVLTGLEATARARRASR